MHAHPIEIIQRARNLLGYRADWFDTLAEWYSNIQLTRRLLEALWEQNQLRYTHALIVNGTSVPRHASTVQRHERITWLVPPALLRVGANHLLLWVTREEERPLLVRGLVTEQYAVTQPQRLDLSVSRPATNGALVLTTHHAAHHAGDCWSIHVGGFLACSLHLAINRELGVTVELLPHQAADLLETLEDVYEKVRDYLEGQIQARESAKVWSGSDDPIGYGKQAKELEELRSYSWLHKTQIAEAIHANPSLSLGEVLEKTGAPKPTGKASANTIPEVIPAAKPVYTSAPATVTGATTVRPNLPTPPVPSQGGASLAGCFVVVVILAALNVGGYFAWQYRAQLQAWFTGSRDTRTREFDERVKKFGGKTGEVQVSLSWDNKNDLDLHVISPEGPNGFELSFRSPLAPSGGKLDVDRNDTESKAVPDPIENIVWPQGKAPKGLYKVHVVHFSKRKLPGCEDPTRYKVRVIVRGREQFSEGEVRHDPARPLVYVTEFRVD